MNDLAIMLKLWGIRKYKNDASALKIQSLCLPDRVPNFGT